MVRKNLQENPKFEDRWSHLYLEHGRIDCDKASLLFYNKEGEVKVPINKIALLFLGPGTRITHTAVKTLADNNSLICWSGEHNVRFYAYGTGGTHSSHRLLHQAALYSNEKLRRRVIIAMYQKRFTEKFNGNMDLNQLRGLEGSRVRAAYKEAAECYGVNWKGRSYNPRDWNYSDPLNRALSTANSCLYGVCHAGIVSAGYSTAIGFIHTGKMLSFVYDVADFYKTEITVPTAFRVVRDNAQEIERTVRIELRDIFYTSKLLSRILGDIAEVLDAPDDIREYPGEFEGRIVSLAD